MSHPNGESITTTRRSLMAGGMAAAALPVAAMRSATAGEDPIFAATPLSSVPVPAVPFEQAVLATGASTSRTLADRFADTINVKDFGAKGDGVTDDTTAIQNAINALPVTGGIVVFPPKTYKVTSTITIGDGTAYNSRSTRQGVILMGLAASMNDGGYYGANSSLVSAAPKLSWAGAADAGPMIFVKGPLLGWGLENMNLEGNSLCTIGLKLQSAQFGTLHRVTIMHFKQVGLLTTCVPAVVFEDTNTQKNIFSNLDIHLPDVSGAVGIKLTSGGAGDADTYLNTFIGVLILLPQTNTTMTGLWLRGCDSNTFVTLGMWGGGSRTKGIHFDYTENSTWPASNCFFNVDPGTGDNGHRWAQTGSSASATRNWVCGVVETNGSELPDLAGVSPGLPAKICPTFRSGDKTTTISGTLFTPRRSGMYRINYYLVIYTLGSGGNITATFGWGDGSGGAQTFTTAGATTTAHNYVQGSVIAEVGNAITYSTTFNSVTGSPAYRLYVVVEELGGSGG